MTEATTSAALLRPYGDFMPATLARLGFQLQMMVDWPQRDPDESDELLDPAKMAELNLAVYHNGHGIHLLGGMDETLHPHERWLYLRAPQNGIDYWWEIEHHSQKLWMANALASELSKHCSDLEFKHLTEAYTPHMYWSAQRYKQNTLGALKQLLTEKRITTFDLHDIAYHYEAWVSRNPEFTDMPRDLVWRMHGLNEAAETASRNRAARMQGLWNDAAFLREGQKSPVAPYP